MSKRLRRIAPLGLAFVSLLVLALPAWALNDQRFTQPRIYDATDGTSDVVTADFNGDGALDLATANRGENDIIDDPPGRDDGDISVVFGKPDGTFGATTEIDSFDDDRQRLADTATDLIAADLDGDDDVDIAFTDQGDLAGDNNGGFGYLITMLNDGSGNFERRDEEELTGGINPVELVAADFDGEGDLEIAVANAGAGNSFGTTGPVGTNGTVSILRNSGGGNFTVVKSGGNPTETLDPASQDSVQSLTTGDYNGDGDPDLALALDDNAAGDADEVFVYLGSADRSFTTLADPTHTVGDAPRDVISADFDRDNNVDFATANNGSDDVSVALGNGPGTFDTPVAYPVAEGPYALTTSDFNIDDKLDIAVANSYNDETTEPNEDQGTVWVLPGKGTNNGDGTFEAGRQTNTADGPVGIVSGSFNTDVDDLPDLATANFGTDGPDKEDGSVAVLLGRYQCNDGANNDNADGIDFGNDPGCESTTDNTESPNPASYIIDDESATEGNSGTKQFVFTVTRSGEGTTQATSVQYRTENGDGDNAKAPSDYVAKTGTANFAAGDTSEDISITVNGDTTFENNETFKVVLSNPSSGSVITNPEAGEGIGTIQNDDQPQCNNGTDDDGDGKRDFGGANPDPGCASATDDTEDPDLPELSINNVSITEGDSGVKEATFTVTRSGNTESGSTVEYDTQDGTATQPSDYTLTTGTLTFAAGEGSKQITVPVNGDTTMEADETFDVVLSNATDARIGDDRGVGTIQNDEPTQCNDGLDNDGDTKRDFGGANPDPGCESSGDDSENPDQPIITISDDTVAEGNAGTTEATFTVTRTGDLTLPSSVDYATENGTATAGSDYVSETGTVTFAPGDAEETITIEVNGDTVDENSETFRVNLSNPSNAFIQDNRGIGTITDEDDTFADLSLDITDSRATVSRGQTLTYELEVTNNGPQTARNTELKLTIPKGTEFTTLPTFCDETTPDKVVTCDLGDMANGTSKSPEIGVKVNRSTTFNVNGEVKSQSIDTDTTDNKETEKTRVR